MALKTEINDERDLQKVRERMVTFPKEAVKEAEAALHVIAVTFADKARERTPVGATEDLRNSIYGEVLPHTGEEIVARVGTPVVHGLPVEYGTGPAAGRPRYMPPRGVLLDWIRKKLGISDPEEAEDVEGRIRWTIYRKGTKGAHMFERAWKSFRSQAGKIWVKMLTQVPRDFWK